MLEPGEVCDDGNDIDADGCNRDCRLSGEIIFEVVFDEAPLLSEQIHDIDHATDGTYVIGGTIAGAGLDAWAARLTRDDELMWSSSVVAQPYDDMIYGVAAAEGGDVFVAGVVDLLANVGDPWVAALAPTGTIVVADRITSPFHGRWLEIENTGTGVIVAGHEDTRGIVRRYGYDLVVQGELDPVAAAPSLVLRDVCTTGEPVLVVGFRPAVATALVEGLVAFVQGTTLQWVLTSQAQPSQHSYRAACAMTDDVLWSAGYDTAASPKWLAMLQAYTLAGEAGPAAPTYVGEMDLGAYYAALATDDEGNVIVGGATVTGPGEFDWSPIVRKYDASGMLLWARAFTASGFPLGSIEAVDVAPDGSIRIAGYATNAVGLRHRYLARMTP